MCVISLAFSEEAKQKKLSIYMKTSKFPEQPSEGKIEKNYS